MKLSFSLRASVSGSRSDGYNGFDHYFGDCDDDENEVVHQVNRLFTNLYRVLSLDIPNSCRSPGKVCRVKENG